MRIFECVAACVDPIVALINRPSEPPGHQGCRGGSFARSEKNGLSGCSMTAWKPSGFLNDMLEDAV